MTNREMTQTHPAAVAQAEGETKARQKVTPPVDIFESKEEFVLLADVPGVRAEDLRIELENGELSIMAPRSGVGRDLISRAETSYEFSRKFKVPGTIDGEGIRAELKHGVLELHLPKGEAAKPRKIPVTAS